ncbi:MFS transporter [Variovorax sp. H27-G14]|uniref:MFS transporter n=1 Tax=Variovorax sp. H27-G14 TaxID=3111914 RepID=UPI0038FCD450
MLSIVILAIAAFVIVSTEFLIVGLLPAMAVDLGVSVPLAGQLVTLFAFTVMLFGPPLTLLLSHLNRKALFVAIMGVFALANALAALAPNLWVLGVARFIPALLLPVFWGTASETATRLVAPAQAGTAVARVYLGITAALLFGIPIGTLAAGTIGWRGAFWGFALLSLLTAVLLAVCMPAQAKPQRMRIGQQIRILRDGAFQWHVALSVVVFTAMFTAYTYLAETLQKLAGVAPAHVGWWLMAFGAVGLLGNALAGKMMDRSPLRATVFFTALLGLGMAGAALVPGTLHWLVVALAAWGIAYTALFPVNQVRVMQAAPQAQAFAGTMNVSAANAGIGLGAVVGGLAIRHLGLPSLGFAAAGIAAVAVAMALAMVRRQAKKQ